MSAIHLQRVSVRMLYDPAFVHAVYEHTEVALADIELSAEERECLLATDRRVWSADAMRRRRSLKALLDEFKVSSAIAVARFATSTDGGALRFNMNVHVAHDVTTMPPPVAWTSASRRFAIWSAMLGIVFGRRPPPPQHSVSVLFQASSRSSASPASALRGASTTLL